MRREVWEAFSSMQRNSIERHNTRTKVRTYLPTVGDYVVVAYSRGSRAKMSANWVGSRRVVRALSDLTVEVEHPITEVIEIKRVSHISQTQILLLERPSNWLKFRSFRTVCGTPF